MILEGAAAKREPVTTKTRSLMMDMVVWKAAEL